MLRSLSFNLSTRSSRLGSRAPAHCISRPSRLHGVHQLRSISTYNADIAGLTDEQAEASCNPIVCISHDLTTNFLHMKFRNAVTEFAEREIAPRAAEIDKSNNFPSVYFQTSLKLYSSSYLTLGLVGEIGRHGSPWRDSLVGIWRPRPRVLPAHIGNGRAFACFRLSWTVLRCSFKSMRKPDPPTRNSRTESQISTGSCVWKEGWEFGHE
jgi:hypothetical protein